MDAPEIMWWMAGEQLEPLPDSWQQTGLMCSATANFSLRSKTATTPDDWIPRVRQQRTSPQSIKTFFDLAAKRK